MEEWKTRRYQTHGMEGLKDLFHFDTDELIKLYLTNRRLRRVLRRTSKVSRSLQQSLIKWISRDRTSENPALSTGGYDLHLAPQLTIRTHCP